MTSKFCAMGETEESRSSVITPPRREEYACAMAATVETSFKDKIRNAVEIPILTRCCFCFPMRRGLIAFAYINLMLTLLASVFMSLYIAAVRREGSKIEEIQSEIPRHIFATCAQLVEMIMTITFIVALHRKHVMLMKVYLCFEVVYSILGLVYSLAFLSAETAGELFLMLFEFTLQIYLAILIWSSIVKMERDGTVKYTRERDPA
ncbi:uncharacterized protein LOC128674098 [Plodia interpunctella]|uniref:uncharacterized protein LOC128674098 n=1 Tax=Plodia interpunctella TaxID=58824 RepID=UPI0023684283|nr:uncharacterized protein LOC128674098 [Plodia interpunctella]